MGQLHWLSVSTLPKLSTAEEIRLCESPSTTFLSIDGIRCGILIFRGNNTFTPLFEGNPRKYCGVFVCSCIYPQAALAFVADSSMVGFVILCTLWENTSWQYHYFSLVKRWELNPRLFVFFFLGALMAFIIIHIIHCRLMCSITKNFLNTLIRINCSVKDCTMKLD